MIKTLTFCFDKSICFVKSIVTKSLFKVSARKTVHFYKQNKLQCQRFALAEFFHDWIYKLPQPTVENWWDRNCWLFLMSFCWQIPLLYRVSGSQAVMNTGSPAVQVTFAWTTPCYLMRWCCTHGKDAWQLKLKFNTCTSAVWIIGRHQLLW